MEKANKHYKFVNSKTGNTIYYCSLPVDIGADKEKDELEILRAKAAIQNGIYKETVYWEEVKEDA